MCLLCPASLFAQLEKGRYMVGGSGSAQVSSTDERSTLSISASPRLGYFFADNFVVGAALFLSLSNNQDYRWNSAGLTPFLRYYFLTVAKMQLFGEARVGVSSNRTYNKISDFTTNDGGPRLGLELGMACFLTPSVALEGSLNYNYAQQSANIATNNIGLFFGFQIFLSELKL